MLVLMPGMTATTKLTPYKSDTAGQQQHISGMDADIVATHHDGLNLVHTLQELCVRHSRHSRRTATGADVRGCACSHEQLASDSTGAVADAHPQQA
jgi:hypothetical protein